MYVSVGEFGEDSCENEVVPAIFEKSCDFRDSEFQCLLWVAIMCTFGATGSKRRRGGCYILFLPPKRERV